LGGQSRIISSHVEFLIGDDQGGGVCLMEWSLVRDCFSRADSMNGELWSKNGFCSQMRGSVILLNRVPCLATMSTTLF